MSGKPLSRVNSHGSFRAWSSGRSEGDTELVSGELEVGDDSVPDVEDDGDSVPAAEDEGDSSRGLFKDGGDSIPVVEDPGSGGLSSGVEDGDTDAISPGARYNLYDLQRRLRILASNINN